MDSDRVMVLDAGRLVEFDSPHRLLARDASLFRGLVTQTGASTAEKLHEIAFVASLASRQKSFVHLMPVESYL